MGAQGRFLLRVVLFLALLGIAYPVVLVVGKTVLPGSFVHNVQYRIGGYGHLLTRLQDAAAKGKVDVLFTGSSLAYRGFDPRIWEQQGLRAFNLGSSGQTPLQTEILLNDHLARLDPDLVIMEVDPLYLGGDGVESSMDLIANRPIDLATVRMAARIASLKTFNTLLYGMVRQCSGRDDGLVQAPISGDDIYVGDGFVERRAGRFAPTAALPQWDPVPLQKQLDALERILATLQRQGRTVILVRAPVTTAARTSGMEFSTWLSSRPALRWIDMTGKAGLMDSVHYYDHHHLNQTGVERFNHTLLDTLRTRGWLPPGRTISAP